MAIKYICRGFDKDYYKFNAIVVPVQQSEEGIIESYNIDIQEREWKNDINKKLKQLADFEFEFGKSEAVYSEETKAYYIFVCARYWKSRKMDGKSYKEWLQNRHRICIESLFECAKRLNVHKILIQPLFFCYREIKEQDEVYRLLEKIYSQDTELNNIEIYTIVNNRMFFTENYFRLSKLRRNCTNMQKFKQEYIDVQMEESLSYSSSLMRIAEIETKYNTKSPVKQLYEDMNNSSWFFDEYIRKYSGTASELARNANINDSTISKIKSHTYKAKSKNVIIALAIALDLNVDERKRFINSAGFSYPNDKHDCFIEQQLKKKRYTSVVTFNKDIIDEYPEFIIETRATKGYKKEGE